MTEPTIALEPPYRIGATMDGLNHRGHPRRSLWAAFYTAGTTVPS